MTNLKFWMLGIAAMFLLFTSCTKEIEVNPTSSISDESLALTAYMESSESPLGKDYVNTDLPAMIKASDVKVLNETNQVYIVDIRSATDFSTGHIANAHNVAFGEVKSHLDAADLTGIEKIAIVCYTGQTASYCTSLLRLAGYDNVYALKWGMCSWHSDFASKWQSSVANTYATQFTATAETKGAKGDMPALSTGKTTAEDILNDRISTLFSEGFDPAKVSSSTVFGNLSSYYIINYWPENHYSSPGHIPGAIQYTPKESLMLSADLQTLPTDKTIVVYCYTGQTSAALTAYLRLLGYDAKSLLFGANGMIYDVLIDNSMTAFADSQIMGYDYVSSK